MLGAPVYRGEEKSTEQSRLFSVSHYFHHVELYRRQQSRFSSTNLVCMTLIVHRISCASFKSVPDPGVLPRVTHLFNHCMPHKSYSQCTSLKTQYTGYDSTTHFLMWSFFVLLSRYGTMHMTRRSYTLWQQNNSENWLSTVEWPHMPVLCYPCSLDWEAPLQDQSNRSAHIFPAVCLPSTQEMLTALHQVLVPRFLHAALSPTPSFLSIHRHIYVLTYVFTFLCREM